MAASWAKAVAPGENRVGHDRNQEHPPPSQPVRHHGKKKGRQRPQANDRTQLPELCFGDRQVGLDLFQREREQLQIVLVEKARKPEKTDHLPLVAGQGRRAAQERRENEPSGGRPVLVGFSLPTPRRFFAQGGLTPGAGFAISRFRANADRAETETPLLRLERDLSLGAPDPGIHRKILNSKLGANVLDRS